MSRSRILVVEDDEALTDGLRKNLEYEGYQVEIETDGHRGLERAQGEPWDLLITELALPGLDGIQLLRCLRKSNLDLPVLILSTRREEADKVLGLRMGADDYVTKPYSTLELMARVEALLRRSQVRSHGDRRRNGSAASGTGHRPRPGRGTSRGFGTIEVNPDSRVVRRAGDPVALTPRELDLLLALLKRQGAVASRKELLREVWDLSVPPTSRTVDTHMAELRRKLEDDPSHPRHLLTVRKVGYRLEA